MRTRSVLVRVLAIVLSAAFLVTESLAQAEPVLPDPGNAGMSRDQQIQLGQKAVTEVYQQMPVLPDSHPVAQYVRQLGAKLVRVIPPDHTWPYQFHVVQQKEINAFAIPGGPIFINVGTITAADNEAELVGVMAHEMSHVYMQHSAKQMQKNTLPSILAAGGEILGQIFGGVTGAIASMGGQMGGGLLSMKYSREDEAQADAVGAIIAYKAGYNPKALAEFFQKLEAQGGSPPQFLSDHPSPGNRVAAVEKEIANWPPEHYQASSAAFATTHQQAQGVTAYTAQQIDAGAKSGQWARQNQSPTSAPATVTPTSAPAAPAPAPASGNLGAVTFQQVRPSKTFVPVTNNSVFTIKHPDNWQLFTDQQSGSVTIGPPSGVAQGTVAYGVMIGGYSRQGGGSLSDNTQQLVQGIMQGNPGMRQTSGPDEIRVNRVPGMSVDLSGQSPVLDRSGAPLAERDWLVTLQRPDGSLLYAVFVAPERDFEQLRPTFESMLRTLRLK